MESRRAHKLDVEYVRSILLEHLSLGNPEIADSSSAPATMKKEGDDISEQDEKAEPRSRAPNNTMLFLNWLESNKIVEFRTGDFVSAYSHVTKEIADKIMVQQLQQGNLQQMGKDIFMVRDKGNERENERNANSEIRDDDT